METIYCTKAAPDALTEARARWGAQAQLGYPGSRDTGPYDVETHRVAGYVATHRSGPRIPVVVPRNQGAESYTVSISEEGDSGASWLYGVRADRPEDAVQPALELARLHGYPICRAQVRVWDGSCQGSTLGHTPLHEEMIG